MILLTLDGRNKIILDRPPFRVPHPTVAYQRTQQVPHRCGKRYKLYPENIRPHDEKLINFK